MRARIPKNGKWYIADIVVSLHVAKQRRAVVHTNTLLIRADSPDRAYVEAVKLGRANNRIYKNDAGETVRVRFQGLSDLNVIHDELEHGAELFYSERTVRLENVRSMVRPKNKLNVFASRSQPKHSPNYMPGSVAKTLREQGFDLK